MKKFYFPFFGFPVLAMVCVAFAMPSCKKSSSFLAATSTTDLTQKSVFADSARTVGFLADIYAGMGYSFNPNRFGTAGMDAATDEANPSSSGSNSAVQFATGTVNAGIIEAGPYNVGYSTIRAVNQFLKNLPASPIKPVNKAQLAAQARFLRAWNYAMLVKHYGGVPLVGDTLLTYDKPINVKRNTYAECVNYILAECDAAAAVLPTTQIGSDYGKISKGACLALKSRVLLYAASPLFNGTTLVTEAGGSTPANLVGYPTADPNRWKLAMDAAAAVIGTGAYELNLTPAADSSASKPGAGFLGLFPQRVNTEYILALMRRDNTELEDIFLPPTRNGGGTRGSVPYQGIVDAFPMANGKLITDATSGYNPNNPYANRDPRLAATVIRDQSALMIRNGGGQFVGVGPVNIYINEARQGKDQDAIYQGTLTGYYHNKMLDPNGLSASLHKRSNRCLPLIRYAEILLNYAEAANEFEGPTVNVYAAIEAIRKRAGLVPHQLPANLSKEAMRAYIQNERRIELAFEEHRFWDVRRWKIAPVTENIVPQGMEVTRTASTVTYKIFNMAKHNFRPAMYLWPFPQSETGKSASLIQNPGY